MKFLWLASSIAIGFSLHATINEPLRCEWFSGYRNDRLHWHLQNPGGATAYSELYRDLQFWENGLVFKTIQRDIAFLVRGSYSAFSRGTLFEQYSQLSFTSNQPVFQTNTTGWGADVSGYISYAANLTDGRTYKWIVLPLLGYSAHFERLNRSTPHPQTTSSYEMISSFPEQLRQNWYGFFLGGALQIEPGGRLIFNVGYTYHWLRTRFNTQWRDQVLSLSNGAIVGDTVTTNSVHVNQSGSLGQTGWAQVDYCFSRAWRMGFGAQIHCFSTPFLSIHVKQNEISTPETFKLRWTPIDGWIQISREL